MDKTSAAKTRDSLACGLYDEIFHQMMNHVNSSLSPSTSTDVSIGILDIAGFGKIYSLFYFLIQTLSKIYAKGYAVHSTFEQNFIWKAIHSINYVLTTPTNVYKVYSSKTSC